MNLRRRRERKTARALDAVTSVTKLWSEWQISKRAGKGVAKAKELRTPSKLKRVLSLKWVRIGGAAAVAGGTAAAVSRKLKGDDAADYSGPAPSVAAEAAVPSPETPPLSAAPDPATQERETEPAAGSSALRKNREETAEPEPDDPELVGDDAAEAALDPDVESPGTGAAEVRATFAAAAEGAGSAAATADDEAPEAKSAAAEDDEGEDDAEATGS